MGRLPLRVRAIAAPGVAILIIITLTGWLVFVDTHRVEALHTYQEEARDASVLLDALVLSDQLGDDLKSWSEREDPASRSQAHKTLAALSQTITAAGDDRGRLALAELQAALATESGVGAREAAREPLQRLSAQLRLRRSTVALQPPSTGTLNIGWMALAAGGAALTILLMIGTLRTVVRPLEEVRARCERLARAPCQDVGREGTGEGAVDQAIETLQSQLRTLGGQLAAEAQQLQDGAGQLSRLIRRLGLTAEQTAEQADEGSLASELVSRNVASVAEALEEVDQSSNRILRAAVTAAEVADGAVRAMRQIRETVGRLEQGNSEIDGLLALVTGIAGRTKMLSLNASIESARAGEAGRTFAVVAEAVRELAAQTARALDDAGSQMQLIQEDIRLAAGSVTQVVSVVEEVCRLQARIAQVVEDQASLTFQIRERIQQAADGSREMAMNVSTVAHTAMAAQASTASLGAVAQNLSRSSHTVERLLDYFDDT